MTTKSTDIDLSYDAIYFYNIKGSQKISSSLIDDYLIAK
ncbi:MAG: hypothetical protein BPH43C_22 [Phage 5P_1]|nr:MAG: hypothetical protein BPH43C_22 [Phage 5P_1]